MSEPADHLSVSFPISSIMAAAYNPTYIDARGGVFHLSGRDQYNYSSYGDALPQILSRLEPDRMDASEREHCLEGTRTQVLQSITNWVSNTPVDQRILWLHGLAGSGKSTISTTIASSYNDQGCLGAFVFFNRDDEKRSRPASVIRTIAYKLGLFNDQIGASIADAIEATPDIFVMPLVRQFAKFVVGPISGLTTTITKPIVIILDAIDECGNVNDRKKLLDVLADETIEIPSVIRIIITSRKEDDISKAFMDKRHIHVRELDLTTDDNKEDITIFLRHRIHHIQKQNPHLLFVPDWSVEDIIHTLALRSAGLFMWAWTACRFIDTYASQNSLNTLLQGDVNANAQSALDGLYATAFKSYENDFDFKSDFLSIMGTIIVARNPLSVQAIDALLRHKRSGDMISKLGCVLMTDKNLIRIIHPSFADYLYNHNRCKSDAFYIDRQLHNRHLAIHCINHLDGFLRRNVCDLTLSMGPVNATLPESICYASTSWIAHVIDMTIIPESFADTLQQFLFEHLLHWMEAMSILNRSREVITSLSRLLLWVEKYLKDRSSLRDIIYDGHRFAYLFAPVIEQHPLLIYESALPFTPTDTTLHAAFRRISIPRIVGRVERFWSPRLMVLSEREQSVLSVAMTPDDSYIISGLDNGTIGLWDAVSGVEASPRLQGHKGAIYSVACSPDGTHIASGSDDCTIRLWDIKTTTEVLVLRGHEQRITAVCFSPTRSSEGMSLLSGSRDCTIRLWTVSSSLHVDSHVVDRYASAINTVAFSPDGQKFVSGAADGTVRIRNPDSGSEILLLSKSHISIHSVAFSPNGQWIVSGSTDGVIRIWNAKLGTQAFQPLKSHGLCRPIRSLAFLPDGNRVISGAENGTIRVWDLERGKEDCSLREHPREVDAIVVSNDGRRIISGSKDHTIGIWDADYLAKVLETENPHVKATLINTTPVNAITAMALSHNGACFAIGFKDKSIRLFDTVKGAEKLRRPLLGHKDIIRSLSFSPVGGKMASGADKKDGCLRIWDTASGKQLPHLPGGGMGDTLSVAFSGNGQRVASGSTDTIIRIWDLRSSMTLPLSLRGHGDEVRCVAFSPDGTQIVSGSNDTTIRVWNTQSGTQVYQSFDQHESFVRSVAFSSDALQIFSMSTLHKVVYTWSPTDACGKLISKTKDINHRTSAVLDPFVLTPNGWIVDISLDRPVSKLPPNISILAVIASAASDRSLIIATDRGAVIIMHFQ